MIYSSNEKGEGFIALTPDENKAFQNGKPIEKRTGDCKGMAKIILKMTRPRSKAKRFPASMGY